GDYIIRFYADSVAQFDVASGRAGVTSLYFADMVNKISENGFKDLENLKSVRLPSGLTNLKAYTFSNDVTVSFYKEINHVYYLGNESNDHLYCFGTTNEEEINIAEGCEVLTNSSFARSDMTISLTLPSSLKIIGDDALKNCESIKNIVIPENVTNIGNYAFQNCYELASINIPNKIEVINESVFEKCRALETIVIPNSVKEIKDAAFYECTNLTLVDMSNVDHFITGGVDMFTGCSNLTIKVKNNDLLKQYKNDPNWKNYNFVTNH
ncbi:MAG: leucine-rich repeat domain-containing protein, partial [Bacilli bacterium]|nr:leucine-rich repeat domain-containing protein [Bacilli bacterium]